MDARGELPNVTHSVRTVGVWAVPPQRRPLRSCRAREDRLTSHDGIAGRESPPREELAGSLSTVSITASRAFRVAICSFATVAIYLSRTYRVSIRSIRYFLCQHLSQQLLSLPLQSSRRREPCPDPLSTHRRTA